MNKVDIQPKQNSRALPQRRLLTLKDASLYLGRSVGSIREMLYGRELPCIQKGNGKVWIDLKDIDNWIDNQKSFM
jgi:hypothetical protein